MDRESLPKTLQEAAVYFATGDNAFNFMKDLRWPNGKPSCPNCKCEEHSFLSTRKTFKCKACKKQYSVKVGTVFEDSAIKLDKWILALWIIANAKNGVSSYEIGRSIGVTQKSAWFMLHRIRLAMHEGTFEKMKGTCEADETFIGAKARNMHHDKRKAAVVGRGPVAMTAVMGVLERGTKKKLSRVKAVVVATRKRKDLHAGVNEYVLKGSKVNTDALPSYNGLELDYIHNVVDHAVEYVNGTVHTNGLENFWSLLKRTVRGTYVAPAPWHLFRYLDEQSFRFNERGTDDQGRFFKAIAGIIGKRLEYSTLTGEQLRTA